MDHWSVTAVGNAVGEALRRAWGWARRRLSARSPAATPEVIRTWSGGAPRDFVVGAAGQLVEVSPPELQPLPPAIQDASGFGDVADDAAPEDAWAAAPGGAGWRQSSFFDSDWNPLVTPVPDAHDAARRPATRA